MSTSPTLAHLLFFHHAFTDDLVDGRFHKGHADYVALSIRGHQFLGYQAARLSSPEGINLNYWGYHS
jgi:hypothetical protein